MLVHRAPSGTWLEGPGEYYIEIRHPFPLGRLRDVVNQTAVCKMRAHEGKWLATATTLSASTSYEQILNAAQSLLEFLNTLVMLSFGWLEALRLAGVWEQLDDGSFRVVESGTPFPGFAYGYRDAVTDSLGTPAFAAALFRLQQEDPDVRDVVSLWSTCPHDWITLYKIYEILRASGFDEIVRGANVAEAVRAFTHTANHERAVGLRSSRHARMGRRCRPPMHPMDLPSAILLFTRLVTHWLLAKASPDYS